MRPRPLVAALLLPAALAACAGGRRVRGVGTAGDAVLEVRNGYLAAVDVFAAREGGGFRTRVGQVFPGRTERFVVGPSIISAGTGLVFVATPTAGSGVASTGVVTVRPGNTVRFNVANDLRNSTVFVR